MFIHPQEQYLTYRGLSIHFNIFQWPNEQMDIFFPMWAYEESYIKINT